MAHQIELERRRLRAEVAQWRRSESLPRNSAIRELHSAALAYVTHSEFFRRWRVGTLWSQLGPVDIREGDAGELILGPLPGVPRRTYVAGFPGELRGGGPGQNL